jgi:hypothetical protein
MIALMTAITRTYGLDLTENLNGGTLDRMSEAVRELAPFAPIPGGAAISVLARMQGMEHAWGVVRDPMMRDSSASERRSQPPRGGLRRPSRSNSSPGSGVMRLPC